MDYIVIMIDSISVSDSFVSNINDFTPDERKELNDFISKYEIEKKLSQKNRHYIWYIRSNTNYYYKLIENWNTINVEKIRPSEVSKESDSKIASKIAKNEKLDIIKSTSRKLKHDISNPFTSVSLDIEFLKEIFEEKGTFEKKIDTMVKDAFTNLKFATDGIFSNLKSVKEISSENYTRKDKNIDSEFIDFEASLFYLIRTLKYKFKTGLSILYQYPKNLKLNINQNSFIRLLYYIIENSLENIQNQESGIIIIKIAEYTNECKITLTDNGSKLKSEISLHQLTRPFFTTKSEHLGLGLTIAQQMISHVDGKLLLASSDKGNLFTDIRIPKIL